MVKDFLGAVLFLPIAIICLFFVYWFFTTTYIHLIPIREEPINPEDATILVLIPPALFSFLLLGFGILAGFFINLIKILGINIDSSDLDQVFLIWCPTLIMTLMLALKFVNTTSIYFLSLYEYLGLVIVFIQIKGLSRKLRNKQYD